MKYRVRLTTRAQLELNKSAIWWADNRDRDQAVRWLAGFKVAIAALEDDPERHPVAPEDDDFPFTLRQILYGLSRKTHRAVFEVRDDDVIVHGIRHLAQQDFTPDDL